MLELTIPWSFQPPEYAEVNPEFGPGLEVWIPRGGYVQAIGRGSSISLLVPSQATTAVGQFGREIRKATSNFVAGISTSANADASFESWLVLIGRTVSSLGTNVAQLGDSTTSGLIADASRVLVRASSNVILTASNAAAPGDVIFFKNKDRDHTLIHRGEKLTNSTNWGNKFVVDGLACLNDSFALLARWTNHSPTDDQIAQLRHNPWLLLAPRKIWVPVSAAGGSTHDATGALVGDAAVVAGTAAHIAVHGTSGVLAGAGAATVGSAVRTREHATTGAAAGSGGVVAGTAVHNIPHPTSGDLAGAGAVTAGSAARATSAFEHATSGDLAGAGATVAGTAARVHVFSATGALAGAGGVVAGVAAHVAVHGTSGVLAGGGGQLSGTAAGSGAAEAVGLAGGFDVDYEPTLWWQRKPKRIKPEEAKAAVQAVAKVVKEKAEEHAADREPVAQRRADVKQAVAPLVSQMPGFDWRPIYDEAYDRALTAAIAQQMREREAQAAQHAAALARQIDDDEVALLAAML